MRALTLKVCLPFLRFLKVFGELQLLKALRSRRAVLLSSDGTRVALTWEGIETNPLLLDAARAAVTALATMHAPSSSPYR